MADPRLYSQNSSSSEPNQQDQRRRLYNPYQDLQIPYRQVYEIPSTPEFLFQEESVAQRRNLGENLTYYTGIGYLAGAATGASAGLYQGFRAAEKGDTLKLRANRILNSSGHEGRKFGNKLGVIGLLYAGMESGLVSVRGTAIGSTAWLLDSGPGPCLGLRTGQGPRRWPGRSGA